MKVAWAKAVEKWAQDKVWRLLSDEEKAEAFTTSMHSASRGVSSAGPSAGGSTGTLYSEGDLEKKPLLPAKVQTFGVCPFGVSEETLLYAKEVLKFESECLTRASRNRSELESKGKSVEQQLVGLQFMMQDRKNLAEWAKAKLVKLKAELEVADKKIEAAEVIFLCSQGALG
jgi:hypothetical protein